MKELNPAQEKAIELIVAGRTNREVAEVIGVNVATVASWRSHRPTFQAALNERRADTWAQQVEQLRGLVSRAVEVLAEDLQSENPKLRQQAAIQVLRSVGLFKTQLEPKDSADVRDVAYELLNAERSRQTRARSVGLPMVVNTEAEDSAGPVPAAEGGVDAVGNGSRDGDHRALSVVLATNQQQNGE